MQLSAANDLSKGKLNISDGTKPAVPKGSRVDLPPEGRKMISVRERQHLTTDKDKETFSDVNKAFDHSPVSMPAKFEAGRTSTAITKP